MNEQAESGAEVVARAMELLAIGSRKKRQAIELMRPIAIEVDDYRRQRGEWESRDGHFSLAPTWECVAEHCADTLTSRRSTEEQRTICRDSLAKLGKSVDWVRTQNEAALTSTETVGAE